MYIKHDFESIVRELGEENVGVMYSSFQSGPPALTNYAKTPLTTFRVPSLRDSDWAVVIDEIGKSKIKYLICVRTIDLAPAVKSLRAFLAFLANLEAKDIVLVVTECDLKFAPTKTSVGELMSLFRLIRRSVRIFRLKASQQRAKSEGRVLGRPLSRDERTIRSLRSSGFSIRSIAKQLKISPSTVHAALKT